MWIIAAVVRGKPWSQKRETDRQEHKGAPEGKQISIAIAMESEEAKFHEYF